MIIPMTIPNMFLAIKSPERRMRRDLRRREREERRREEDMREER